ncbi:MAG: hypothetical protein AAFP76_09255 [Bacteroidota bacterium]
MERKKPIIIIPGIQGTKLFNVNEKDFTTVWSGIKKFFSNIHMLRLQKNGISDIGAETIIERADVENLAYSEIINYLKSKGYRVFIFGYDWRKSNMETAKELKLYLERLTDKLNTSSFNFLTHSMGALVLSSYLKIISEEQRNKVLHRAIFAVPPFLGSVEASFNLVVGKSRLFNSSDDFRKIARTFPSVYELLPVYEGAYEFEDPAAHAHFNPFDFDTCWQQVKDLDPKRKDTHKKHKLISYRLQKLKEVRNENKFIFDFAQCSPEFRKRLIVIAGGNARTKDKIFVRKEEGHLKNFFDYEKFDEPKNADGTVPHASASAFKDVILTLRVNQRALETWADSRFIGADWHAFFLNNGRVQNVIKRFLSDATQRENWYDSAGGKIEKIT